MAEHHIPDGLTHEIYQLFEGGHTTDEIRTRLSKRKIDGALIEELIATIRARRMQRRRGRGLIFCGIGAVILIMAFAVTYVLHLNDIDTSLPLYGLTTLGITLLFIGMIFLFG